MMRKILKYGIILLVFAFVIWTFYFLYRKSEKPAVAYQTVSPFRTTIVKKTVATGSIIPRREVNMKSQVSGIVEKLYIIAGQEIKQGDVIAKVKIIPNMINMANAENRVRQGKINLENARQEYERFEGLFKQNAISKVEFQPYELKLKLGKEELNAAEDNLALIKEGVTRASGTATNTLIRSTITGMVLDVPVKEGGNVIESNTFNEGTSIASVANMSEMIFEGKVDESEVGKIKEGMPLELTIGAIDKERFAATLEYIAPKGVTENGAIQFLIRAALTKHKGSFLRAGYSANADIILSKKEKVLAIPESVLHFEKEKIYVDVLNAKGTYDKRYIRTDLSDGINIEVVEGLKSSDKLQLPLMDVVPNK